MKLRKRFSALLAALLLVCVLPVTVSAEESKTLTVDASAQEVVAGSTYKTVQSAIEYIHALDAGEKDGWTIEIQSGEYNQFMVYTDVTHLTVKAAQGAEVTIHTNHTVTEETIPTLSEHNTPAIVLIAQGTTLQGLTIQDEGESTEWFACSVMLSVPIGEDYGAANGVKISDCKFQGKGNSFAIFADQDISNYTVEGCGFDQYTQAIAFYGDNTSTSAVSIRKNTFTNCSYALHGYYGQVRGEVGVLTFANNTVTGTDALRCKVVIQDSGNGAVKADVRNNHLTNALIGLVNLCEEGETVSDPLTSNTLGKNCFYVEAIEPGTIEFYANYKAPASEKGKGYWKLTGLEDFDVDWGKNPEGSTAHIQQIVDQANAANSTEFSVTGIDKDHLIKTFTWFKDGIYWVSNPETTSPPSPKPSQTFYPDYTETPRTSGTPAPTQTVAIPEESAAVGPHEGDEYTSPKTGDSSVPHLAAIALVLSAMTVCAGRAVRGK